MQTQTANLFLLEDLEDVSTTSELTDADRAALQAVAGWIRAFVATPNKDLGRAGPVCPYVPGAFDAKTLWLAPEHIGNRSALDVVQLVNGYKRLFLHTPPIDGDDADYKALVVVFTDVSADQAREYFDDIQQQLGVPSYAEDGLVLGGFYESNEGSSIYNPNFRPFRAPVPFLLIRRAVISDWKFFLDNKDWLGVWARRFGESAVYALAKELRGLPWRARRD